ncbi:MAG TPA: aminotransferase class III-fold pyridoxal phosphate-dependent enzyme [Herpetosiphonaceae bacterium]
MATATAHPAFAADGLPRPIEGALTLDRSNDLLAEARRLIPGLTQSLMKRPEQFALGSFPVYLATGEGALVRDVDGNEYIDFICGLGATTLGHNHPAVLAAIRDHLGDGLLHSLPTEIELDATRELLALIPGAEMARFFKTGADATSAAIRLARHATGKERVITVGYNGWHDHFMFDTPGVPAVLREYTQRMPLFVEADEAPLLAAVAEGGATLAAVLLSVPYTRELSAPFLRALRAACDEAGVLLVFDEVVTGFRVALGGIQEYYGVAADFVCLSKGIAGGMPLSAIAGPAPIMAKLNDLQVSTTFGGELLSLYVCQAVLREYRQTDYVATIAALGRRLRDGINACAAELGLELRILGYDAIPFFRFAADMPTHARLMESFLGAMAKRGVLLRRDVNFICGAHTAAQIDWTVAAAREALIELIDSGAVGAQAREA